MSIPAIYRVEDGPIGPLGDRLVARWWQELTHEIVEVYEGTVTVITDHDLGDDNDGPVDPHEPAVLVGWMRGVPVRYELRRDGMLLRSGAW